MTTLRYPRYIAVCQFLATDRDSDAAYTRRERADQTKSYEYMLPDNIGDYYSDAASLKYAVVCTSNDHKKNGVTHGSLRIVKIVSVRESTEQEYDGDLKPVVIAFDTDIYTDWTAKLAKRRSIMQQIEKKVSERSKVAQLEALAGSDPEALALLDALKNLDQR